MWGQKKERVWKVGEEKEKEKEVDGEEQVQGEGEGEGEQEGEGVGILSPDHGNLPKLRTGALYGSPSYSLQLCMYRPCDIRLEVTTLSVTLFWYLLIDLYIYLYI